MDRQSVAEREGVERPFDIEVQEPAQGTLLVRLAGSLGGAAVDSINDCLDRRLAESELRRLVVDLGEVVQLAPSALNLWCTAPPLPGRNRHLVLVGVSQPAVNRALRMSGLLPLFDIRPTVEATLRGAGSPAVPSFGITEVLLLPVHPHESAFIARR